MDDYICIRTVVIWKCFLKNGCMKIVGVAFFVKIFAFQSVILHQSPLLLNSQTNYRKNLLCSVACLRLNRLITSIIFLPSMMRITNGCITDSTRPTKQLNLSATSTQQETGTISTTDTDTSTLGSYYNSTVASLTDDCGVGAYSVATGKAVAYGIVVVFEEQPGCLFMVCLAVTHLKT